MQPLPQKKNLKRLQNQSTTWAQRLPINIDVSGGKMVTTKF